MLTVEARLLVSLLYIHKIHVYYDVVILTKTAVMRAPLLGGERKPRQAKMRAMKAMKRICRPLPTQTERSMVALGGLKTSPWTNFQPKSSWMSSCG